MENLSVGVHTLLDIREFIAMRNPICVVNVEKISGGDLLLMIIRIPIKGEGPMNAKNVIKLLWEILLYSPSSNHSEENP